MTHLLASPRRGRARASGRDARARSGKTALTLAILVAVGVAARLWSRAGEPRRTARESEDRPARPEASAPEPELAPAVAAERQNASPASATARPCRLVLQVLPPQPEAQAIEPAVEFTGTAFVRAREIEGAFARVVELTAARPRAELECPPGEYEFTLERYGPEPLGALPIRALLDPDGDQIVTLLLARLQVLTGRLVHEGEQDLGGVRVALERRGRTMAETHTNRDGTFALQPLPVSEYQLAVGDPVSPLVPRRAVALEKWLGDMRVAVPALLALEIRVVDAEGRGVAGARVEGLGQRGGRVTGVTGADGSLQVAQLPPGTYRITAEHATLGHGGASLALTAEVGAPLVIGLRTDSEEE